MSDQQPELTIEVVSADLAVGGVQQSIEERKDRALIFGVGEIVD